MWLDKLLLDASVKWEDRAEDMNCGLRDVGSWGD